MVPRPIFIGDLAREGKTRANDHLQSSHSAVNSALHALLSAECMQIDDRWLVFLFRRQVRNKKNRIDNENLASELILMEKMDIVFMSVSEGMW